MIFRHLRPHWFNAAMHVLSPHVKGGVSFALVPTDTGTYDYWLYICPESTTFSSKQAVKTLRDTVERRGIKPWGTLVMNKDPLLDQLIKEALIEREDLPSDVSRQVRGIVAINMHAEMQKMLVEVAAISARGEYEKC